MGRTTIVPENRMSSEVERFPSFRFQAKGERARVACLERQQLPDGRNVLTPWMEFVHRIEKPEEKDGQPLQKKLTKKDRDGNETTEMVWATEWVSSPICLGDKAILLEKGLDVANCPVCRASEDHPEITQHRGLGAPVVRYAMNIVRFSTRPGGFLLAEPFGAQIVVWSFTEKRFNRLDDLNRKLTDRGQLQYRKADGTIGVRPYDITDVDVLLGECEDVGWQRFDIDVAEGLAMWRRSQPTAQYVQQLWLGAGMRATDEQLQLACGKPVTNRAYLDSDIGKAVSGWNKALRGGPAPSADPFGASFGGQQATQDMATGMGNMLNELATPPVPQPPGMGVPQVTQPTVPAAPQPTVQPMMPPTPAPQVPQVPQPTVQPAPGLELPPPPPTPEQMQAVAGGYGLDQFAPQPTMQQAAMQQYDQPAAGLGLPQAAAPDTAALQAQQMAALAAAGVPQQMLPQQFAPQPHQVQQYAQTDPMFAGMPQPAAPGAVPVTPQAPPAPAVPVAPQPPVPSPPAVPQAGAAPDLFTAQVPPPAPEGAAVEFDALANF